MTCDFTDLLMPWHFLCQFQEAAEHAQATGHVNFQEYRWQILVDQRTRIKSVDQWHCSELASTRIIELLYEWVKI